MRYGIFRSDRYPGISNTKLVNFSTGNGIFQPES